MTFEVFHRPRTARGPALVTVTPEGVLRLNAAAYRLIDQPTHVLLLVDREARKVAVRAVAGASNQTYRVGRSGMISATALVRELQLAPGPRPAALEGDLLVVGP
jgi:hypothetical protein